MLSGPEDINPYASLIGFQYEKEEEKLAKSFEESFDIFEYFALYNDVYFDSLLGAVQLSWSMKMTTCAGVYSVKDNIPLIRLSEPLLKYRTHNETRETLLHEMIHAYCHFRQYDMTDDLSGHGKYFKQKMNEINKDTGLNITVYHTFHDEVEHYAKHIWRCDGKCKNKPPYYGFVRRQMNRPPQKADKWWIKHKKSCGGTFIKIAGDDNKKAPMRKKKKGMNGSGMNKNKENKAESFIDDNDSQRSIAPKKKKKIN